MIVFRSVNRLVIRKDWSQLTSGTLYASWFKYTFSVELASTENVAGNVLETWSFLCRNISLHLFPMSELWRLAFLLAVQSIPKNTTWVLWLGDWWFFKQLFISKTCCKKWWKLAFLCIFCMKIAFTLMHFILKTTFNTSTNLWLKSQLSTYLSFFGSGNVSETILPHFFDENIIISAKNYFTTDRYVKIENLKKLHSDVKFGFSIWNYLY